jgi:hypothetical protein
MKMARFAVLPVALVAVATLMPAQEEKKEKGETRSAPERRREGEKERSPQREHVQREGERREQAQPQQHENSTHPAPNSRPVNSQGGQTFGNRPNAPSSGAVAPRREPAAVTPRPATVDRNRPLQAGPRVVTTPRGDVIRRDSRGQVTQVRLNNGTVVYHPANGPRRVEVVRPGGRVVVASAAGHGYVQQQVVVRNTTIIRRTYIYNGAPQVRIYRPVVFRGVSLAVYTPVRYYRPAFYVWAFNPWPRPIAYTWGWGPWYAYYGPYFTPYPVYASPSLWLTDYLIASTLEAAYQERMAAQANAYASAGQAPLTPEVKQAIADEVHRQIDLEKAQQQGAPQSVFADNGSHVFVVHDGLNVSSSNGECAITEGDVLQMNGPPAPNASSADLIVLASRGGDCRKGSTVSVALQDLQEMSNQMRATIDRGMSELQAKQGQNGLPALPPNSAGTVDSPYAQDAQPDPNAGQEMATASREADQAEQQALSQGQTTAAPPTLTLGMSLDQVTAIQGQPLKVVDLGAKKVYLYKDLKITFTAGQVTDIAVQ